MDDDILGQTRLKWASKLSIMTEKTVTRRDTTEKQQIVGLLKGAGEFFTLNICRQIARGPRVASWRIPFYPISPTARSLPPSQCLCGGALTVAVVPQTYKALANLVWAKCRELQLPQFLPLITFVRGQVHKTTRGRGFPAYLPSTIASPSQQRCFQFHQLDSHS